jgi:hypothetical protein
LFSNIEFVVMSLSGDGDGEDDDDDDDDDYVTEVVFSEEATIHKPGIVNGHNCRSVGSDSSSEYLGDNNMFRTVTNTETAGQFFPPAYEQRKYGGNRIS